MCILSFWGRRISLDLFCLPGLYPQKTWLQFRRWRRCHQRTCPAKTFGLIHSAARGIHKRSICRPKNCDALNLSRDSQWEVSSSTFSQHLIWFQDLSPFSEQTPSQPPSSSTTILECRREWPGRKGRNKPIDNTCGSDAPADLESCQLLDEPRRIQSASRRHWGSCRLNGSNSMCWERPPEYLWCECSLLDCPHTVWRIQWEKRRTCRWWWRCSGVWRPSCQCEHERRARVHAVLEISPTWWSLLFFSLVNQLWSPCIYRMSWFLNFHFAILNPNKNINLLPL